MSTAPQRKRRNSGKSEGSLQSFASSDSIKDSLNRSFSDVKRRSSFTVDIPAGLGEIPDVDESSDGLSPSSPPHLSISISDENTRFNIGGGFGSQTRNLPLSPISSQQVKKSSRWLKIVCCIIFSAVVSVICFKIFLLVGESATEGQWPGISFLVCFGAILLFGSVFLCRRRCRSDEQVLITRQDDSLAMLVSRARKEWQAGRFASSTSPRECVHLEPTPLQRQWASVQLGAVQQT